MNATPQPTTEQSRSEARRAQILAAAEDCFRKHGFHGASIAQISRESGMSAGHIYHYFENKEAIIAAIIEQDLRRLMTMTAELRAAADVQEAMVRRAAEGVLECLDRESAGLKLEIVAEASRNPRMAEIVRNADRQCLAGLMETVDSARRAAPDAYDARETAAIAEVISALFEGLRVRCIRNPELDAERVARVFQRVIGALVSAPATPKER